MQIRDIKFPGFRRLNEETDTGTIPPRPPVPSRTLTRLTGPQNPEDEPKKERLSAKLLKALLSIKHTQEHIADMQYFSVPRRLPDVFDTGSQTVTIATPATPDSPETLATITTPGYDRIQLNHFLSRNSPRLTVVNDGPGTIYVITTDEGERWSAGEAVIQYGEYMIFNNVFEIRLRSPQLSSYRATESEIYTSYAIATADINRPDFDTGRTIMPAIPAPTQLPTTTIPDGFALVVKALNTNAGRIYVANSAANALIPANSYSLGINEFVTLKVTNADLVYIYSAVVGDGIESIVEV